jgi:hypothetical protein
MPDIIAADTLRQRYYIIDIDIIIDSIIDIIDIDIAITPLPLLITPLLLTLMRHY